MPTPWPSPCGNPVCVAIATIRHRTHGQPLHPYLSDLEIFWNAEARQRLSRGRSPLKLANLITVDSHADHQNVLQHLTQTARPATEIAASGMCSGGRIVNYLKAMLSDARPNVLFVGYQAKGTPGQIIQQYGSKGGYI